MIELTKEQSKLIASNGNTILKAGPGSGKTSSLVTLINKRLEEWQKGHRGIAILSFCNSSVEELKNKIDNIDYPHYIGTIDGFAEKYIFYPFSPSLFFKNKDKAKIITNDTYFSELKDKCYFRKECYKCNHSINDILISTDGKIKVPKEKCIGNNLPCVRYKKMVLKSNCVTYDDAISIAIQIIKKYPKIIKLLAKRFPLIIIDEAQDTSANQMELIEQFEINGSTIIIVGDSDQAIYEWRTATPEIFVNKYDNSNYNKIEFLENHRSSQNICNATYKFSTLSKTAIAVGEFKDDNEKPIVIFYENLKQTVDFFNKYCEEKKIDSNNRKILVRGRNDIENNPYCDILELWKNETTEGLIKVTLLKSSGKINEARNILQKILFELIFKETVTNIEEKANVILKKYNIEQWNRIVNDFLIEIPSSNIILKQWDKLMQEKLNKLLGTKTEKYIKIKRNSLNNVTRDFKEKELYYFDKENTNNSSEIATIHSAKGKTYEAIMLIIKPRGKLTFNSLNKEDNETEEVRTAYVAMTRPQEILIIALPKSVKKAFEKSTKFDKRFWSYIDL